MKDLTNQPEEEESVPLPVDAKKAKLGLKLLYVKLLKVCMQHPNPNMSKIAEDELAEVLADVDQLTKEIESQS